ncbi:MAG: transglutaminase-like domain-containing protein, partial [Actinomycetes bacterium]
MTPWSEAFAQTVRTEPVDLTRACLQLGAEAAERDGRQRVDPLNQSLGQLEFLAADVTNQGDGVTRLRRTLAGFQGDPSDYDDLRSSLLPDVLDRRRGLPILLSVVWLDVARRVGIPAYGVGLPGHFVVAVGDPDGYHEVVDPFAGG